MVGVDHLNNIERKLIDNLRTGTFQASGGAATAWSTSDVTVFGQFPETTETKYPSIIVQHIANGLETQFMGQHITSGSTMTPARGELYGEGFNIFVMVDKESSITVSGQPYKERRLLNYLMLNVANVLMDCDFDATGTEVEERHYSGFSDINYNPELEIWTCRTSMIVTFKNSR